MLKDIKSEYLNLFFQMVLIVPIMACWQSGDAADCKSVNTCSIHVHASKLYIYTPRGISKFLFLRKLVENL